MKKLFTLLVLSVAMVSSSFAGQFKNEVKALKAQVHEIDGIFVLVPNDFKDHQLIPLGLPAEYEVEGMEVTVDGLVSKCHHKKMDIAINSIAVEQDVQKQLGLHHIEYNIKSYSLTASKF